MIGEEKNRRQGKYYIFYFTLHNLQNLIRTLSKVGRDDLIFLKHNHSPMLMFMLLSAECYKRGVNTHDEKSRTLSLKSHCL